MHPLAATDRLLLGPGPSPVSARVMRAMATPVLGHLDPALLASMDDVRASLLRIFQAPEGSLALAVSGTGTAGMETAIANLVGPGTRVVVVVNGYFGARIAEIATRYGADVRRIEGEWGRALDPDAVAYSLAAQPADVVAVVHAETSTGVENPVPAIAAAAHAHGALLLVDAVTSLGGMPVDVAGWGIDACYSGSQKCIGAPSGLAPIVFTPAALARRVPCRSFYLDLRLLEEYWADRKYHHTIGATLVFALREALAAIEDETLAARWARHKGTHQAFVAALGTLGLSLLPPEGERLWTLHTVKVPSGVDEAAVRTALRDRFNIEIGAGIGPLAGKVWRIGLMGAGSTASSIATLIAALREVRT